MKASQNHVRPRFNFKSGKLLGMRYVGQVHKCAVEIGGFEINAQTIEQLKQAFHSRHEERYTYAEPNSIVEVVNVEYALYGRVKKPAAPNLMGHGAVDNAIIRLSSVIPPPRVDDGAML